MGYDGFRGVVDRNRMERLVWLLICRSAGIALAKGHGWSHAP